VKNKKAGIEYLGAIMLICLTGILLLFSYNCKAVKLCQIRLKDSVDMSALAAAVIDMDAYYETGFIRIKNVIESRKIFEETLRYNLELDENFYPEEKEIFENITIHEFIIYRIINNEYMMKCVVYPDHKTDSWQMDYSKEQRTPDGKVIESDTIYVDIGTYINGFPNVRQYEHVTSCVDIVSTGEGEDEND